MGNWFREQYLYSDYSTDETGHGTDFFETYMKNLVSNRLAYSFGDIEMQVKLSDYEAAKEALIEGGFALPEDFESINQ